MSARLARYGWLRRTIELTLSDRLHVVEYSGIGLYDRVSIDGVAVRKFCWYWFVPRFEFRIGERLGIAEVRVWPWCCLRSLVLRVDEQVVYAESSRFRFTIRDLMAAVATVALMCFLICLANEHLLVGVVTQCYDGRTVPIQFAIVDAETGRPVPGARVKLSRQNDRHHALTSSSDGLASLTFKPGCDERIYLLGGLVYTVYYSNWELEVDAEGYERVKSLLSEYRGDTRYPGNIVPPPIVIRVRHDPSKL